LLKEAQAGSSEKDSPNVLLQCNITREHDSYKRIAKNIDPAGVIFGCLMLHCGETGALVPRISLACFRSPFLPSKKDIQALEIAALPQGAC
jgi:hypothetical protein